MLNKVLLIGNLGSDPELRATTSGTSVCTLRLATNERTKDAEGNWKDETEWHRVVAFGKTAENVHRYMEKGGRVHVEGRIRTNKWEDRDGNNRYTTEVIARSILFLTKGRGYQDQSAAPQGSNPPKPARREDDVNYDDIPF